MWEQSLSACSAWITNSELSMSFWTLPTHQSWPHKASLWQRWPMTWHSNHWDSGTVSRRGLTLISLYWWDGLGSETQPMFHGVDQKNKGWIHKKWNAHGSLSLWIYHQNKVSREILMMINLVWQVRVIEWPLVNLWNRSFF